MCLHRRNPDSLSPTIFYSPLLTTIRDLEVPETFSNTAKDFYPLLLRKICTSPILHRSFSLTVHWQRVCDNFTENFTNDLAWLISLQAVKVRDSIRNNNNNNCLHSRTRRSLFSKSSESETGMALLFATTNVTSRFPFYPKLRFCLPISIFSYSEKEL